MKRVFLRTKNKYAFLNLLVKRYHEQEDIEILLDNDNVTDQEREEIDGLRGANNHVSFRLASYKDYSSSIDLVCVESGLENMIFQLMDKQAFYMQYKKTDYLPYEYYVDDCYIWFSSIFGNRLGLIRTDKSNFNSHIMLSPYDDSIKTPNYIFKGDDKLVLAPLFSRALYTYDLNSGRWRRYILDIQNIDGIKFLVVSEYKGCIYLIHNWNDEIIKIDEGSGILQHINFNSNINCINSGDEFCGYNNSVGNNYIYNKKMYFYSKRYNAFLSYNFDDEFKIIYQFSPSTIVFTNIRQENSCYLFVKDNDYYVVAIDVLNCEVKKIKCDIDRGNTSYNGATIYKSKVFFVSYSENAAVIYDTSNGYVEVVDDFFHSQKDKVRKYSTIASDNLQIYVYDMSDSQMNILNLETMELHNKTLNIKDENLREAYVDAFLDALKCEPLNTSFRDNCIYFE